MKKGKPIFPVNQNGIIDKSSILYNAPKIEIIEDNSDDAEFSILYQTKFRIFSLHITDKGFVTSSLTLHWEAIYEDLAPFREGEIEPLRSFTPW